MRRRLHKRHGQALAEASLAVPLVMLVLLGGADGGRAFYYREAVSNAARQGLRLAAAPSQEATGDAACNGRPNTRQTLVAQIPPQPSDPLVVAGGGTIAKGVGLESSTDGTPGTSKAAGTTSQLAVTWDCDASGRAVVNSATTPTDPADPASATIEVRVSYTFVPITPVVVNVLFPNKVITSDVLGRAEYP
ncbi:MAG: hypothetical protein NVSMB29_12330 [Candidatus Dormibacteria bacterium]